MKIKMAVLAGLVALGAEPASAQRYGDEPVYRGLSSRMIERIVRSRGLTPVDRAMLRDGVYAVRAVDDAGQPLRVLIEAGSGRIVRIHAVAGRDAPRLPPLARRAPGDYEEREFSPRPPRVITGRPGAPPDDVDDFEASAPPPRAAPRDGATGALPPARTPQRNASPAATAAPTPRPRPVQPPAQAAVSPATDSTGATSAPVQAAPARPKGLPRVILQGGPMPKAERTAGNAPGVRSEAPAREEKPAASGEAAPATPAPAAIPPVAPLE